MIAKTTIIIVGKTDLKEKTQDNTITRVDQIVHLHHIMQQKEVQEVEVWIGIGQDLYLDIEATMTLQEVEEDHMAEADKTPEVIGTEVNVKENE